MMNLYKVCLFLALTFSACSLFAMNENAGTRGFAFMNLLYSARAAGMANAFTGLANDGDAVFFNTAGLAQTSGSHLKTTYINYIEGLQGGSLVYKTDLNEEWKIAPFVQFMVSDAIPRTIEVNGAFGGQVGTFGTSDIVVGIGFARNMHPALDFGFNVKYMYEKLDTYDASAIAVDFSVMHQTNVEELRIGLVLRNFGWQLTHFTDAKHNEELPTMIVAGASYRFRDKGFINFDLARPFDNDFFFRLGLEYNHNAYLTLRTGLDSRMDDYRAGQTLDFTSGLAFGIGINWNRYIVDFGVSSKGGLGFVNQISISYKF